jgi:glycosyltransferase involved in cell wall biosynthesis
MKIAIFTSRFPFPLNKGDKLRIFHQIKELSKQHDICLLAVNNGDVTDAQLEAVRPYCKEMHVFPLSKIDLGINVVRAFAKGIPFQAGVFYKPAFHEQMKDIVARFQPEAIHCHLIRMSEYCRDITNIRKSLDYMDTFSVGAKRWHETANFLLKPILSIEYKRLLAYEAEMFDVFDGKCIITEQDRAHIPHPKNQEIAIISNGVDFEEFQPMEGEKKYDLLFMGYMGYAPNVDAVCFFAKDVLPLLLQKRPTLKLLIAGHTPDQKVLDLASEHIDVVPTWARIRDSFVLSRVMIAPMFISIGLQNKIIQSMAMKIPVVCSRLANRAVKAAPNCIREADTPEEFVKEILDLLENPTKSTQLAENAYHYVHQTFDWGKTTEQLEIVITGKEVANKPS